MPKHEIEVIDRRDETQPPTLQPKRGVLVVQDKRTYAEGLIDTSQYEIPTEEIMRAAREASGYFEAQMAGLDRMLAMEQGERAVIERPDAALWAQLWPQVPEGLRRALQAAYKGRSEAELAAGEALLAVQTHQERRPTKSADVPRWGERESRLRSELAAYESFAEEARAVYEATAARAFEYLRGALLTIREQRTAAVNKAEADAKRLRADADSIERVAREETQAVGRLLDRFNHRGAAFFEEIEL